MLPPWHPLVLARQWIASLQTTRNAMFLDQRASTVRDPDLLQRLRGDDATNASTGGTEEKATAWPSFKRN
jgi:hypothetical protein